MKLKVIGKIGDEIIACNQNNIICFDETSLRDDKGEDALYHQKNIHVCMTLNEKNIRGAEWCWWYKREEWNSLNMEFQKEQKLKRKKPMI